MAEHKLRFNPLGFPDGGNIAEYPIILACEASPTPLLRRLKSGFVSAFLFPLHNDFFPPPQIFSLIWRLRRKETATQDVSEPPGCMQKP